MLRNIFEFIKVVVVSLLIILPIRFFVIQPFYVKGASMEPNFHDHEYLIVDEVSYRFNSPSRGEVIVFRYPLNPKEYFIKRVIALPGEEVEIVDGDIYIYNEENPNGFLLKESLYLDDSVDTYNVEEGSTELDGDEYFVLGDNRHASKDSRSFGPVNKSFIVGRVMLRAWPFSSFSLFKHMDYYNN
ncbi:signal peptidase I [Candidatus Falkowbacteria bacterium HGW-Falkowbacteria-1]|jgi:signal peptidase I|uniref:Signal peptidase I n=1 Tax=Candidatus Falkowbacteria bacterium HGW-Falkowbacteria-1 TaxID=2013768 RepID=A0A2N2EAD7_9BACT|nr:MAG: signal peptidase I [Candidatus Falkowbacteria bacterium HGW-Falkowbacteria-1]